MLTALTVLVYGAAMIYALVQGMLADCFGAATLPVMVLVSAVLITYGTSGGQPLLVYLGAATILAPVAVAAYVRLCLLLSRLK